MKNKNCKNCNFFVQHYKKDKTKFDMVNCGHCTNKKSSERFGKTDIACEFWTCRNDKNEKPKFKQSVSILLDIITDRLDELKEILEGS